MKILVHEFASGGGLAGQPVRPSLAREGGAMLAALVADLAALGEHQIVTTTDARFPLAAAPGVEVVRLRPGTYGARLGELIVSVDAVWLIAPEIGGCLERLTALAERKGTVVLGSSACAIRRAADKARLRRRLRRHGISHPTTHILRGDDDSDIAATLIGYPLVVKPARGAGCSGVCVARHAGEWRQAIDCSRGASGGEPLLLQEYVRGVAASVSLLADGRNAVALTVNGQSLCGSFERSYRGGVTPLEHPNIDRAVEAALRTCRALPGLRGCVGVDVVLTKSEAVVIEVNPRLTTAYLGIRRAIDDNIAALALDACAGSLPAAPRISRRVRFDAGGHVSEIDRAPVTQT